MLKQKPDFQEIWNNAWEKKQCNSWFLLFLASKNDISQVCLQKVILANFALKSEKYVLCESLSDPSSSHESQDLYETNQTLSVWNYQLYTNK